MKPASRKLGSLVFVFAASFIITACLFWDKDFLISIMGPSSQEYTLQEMLQQRQKMEIKKTRKEFPPLEEIEKIIGYDALLGKSDNSHVLNMSAEMKSAQKKSGNQSSQKTAPIDTEKLDAKMSNEVPDETDRGHYSVQVAALSNALAAEELTTRLIEEGFQAYMEQTKGKNGNVLFRIRIGKYDVRPDAEKALEQLVKSGRTGFVSKN